MIFAQDPSQSYFSLGFCDSSSAKYFPSFQWFVPEGLQNSSVHHFQLSLRAKYQYMIEDNTFTCFTFPLLVVLHTSNHQIYAHCKPIQQMLKLVCAFLTNFYLHDKV